MPSTFIYDYNCEFFGQDKASTTHTMSSLKHSSATGGWAHIDSGCGRGSTGVRRRERGGDHNCKGRGQ